MHQPNDKFSIAVSGEGRALGMFFTEFLARFPNATCYDRTGQTQQAIQQEVTLGKSAYASTEFRRSALVAERNLASPPKSDVTVRFEQRGQVENATVAGKVSRRILSFDFGAARDLQDAVNFVVRVVQAVGMAQ